MSRSHYATDEACRKAFASRAETDPAAAVHLALGRGFSVTRDDVPTPHLAQLEALPKELRGEYALRHAAEISRERRALVLVAAQANVTRDHEQRAQSAHAAARAAFVEERTRELETEWNAARMNKWREQAEREAAVRFDGASETKSPAKRERK